MLGYVGRDKAGRIVGSGCELLTTYEGDTIIISQRQLEADRASALMSAGPRPAEIKARIVECRQFWQYKGWHEISRDGTA